MTQSRFFACIFFLFYSFSCCIAQEKNVLIVNYWGETAREIFGRKKLTETLKGHGYTVGTTTETGRVDRRIMIYIVRDSANSKRPKKKEGFQIVRNFETGEYIIAGNDPSGVLYGCLELADRINKAGELPVQLNFSDSPEMVLRGTCIGMQKPYYLPGREVYEYPYTPETFPWFYDKKMWIQYLDSMAENRLNSLYLWNGHPFASLVRLKDYPYAVEVDDATFKKNEEIFKFLTEEADKRGIWVIQMFYNIIVSKPFAEHHNIKTQDRNRPIIPLISDYTRKSIAAFVEKYPNVGLMVALGEAMEGVGQDDIEWFTKTIIPGVKDGLNALGKTEEPPIVLRAHDTDAPSVIKSAKGLYSNLYTEAKFNGEALTTDEPRGSWADLHRTLSRAGSVQIENVHILANLEPFRYGAADFIQRCVKGMHNIYEANGLHLYPQASYWDWPYAADNTSPRLLQIERDWIWYKEWSRYAWNCHRDPKDEKKYWAGLLASRYGVDLKNGMNILEAYEQSGQIAPKILRRFGITDGNRQTMTLGMLMTQLINPYRFGLFDLLYDSESPVGEKLIEYAEKDWKGQKHIGETPPQIINEVIEHGKKAVAAIQKAALTVKSNKAEFGRLKNDMLCYQAMAEHYAQKAQAALYVLRYKYSNDVKDLDKAVPFLQQSVVSYKRLVKLTEGSYLYANSMQTQQRKIPIRGVNGTFKTWKEVLVPFEAELARFQFAIDSIKKNPTMKGVKRAGLINEQVNIDLNESDWYTIDTGAVAYSDTALKFMAVAEELKRLRGIKMNFQKQVNKGTVVSFENKRPVKVLIGYFNKKDPAYLKAPELETDASANNYGQSETKIANAIVIKGMPLVNIHTYSFKPGNNTLTLGKGACLILGFVSDDLAFPLYDAGLTEKGVKKEIDWLFE